MPPLQDDDATLTEGVSDDATLTEGVSDDAETPPRAKSQRELAMDMIDAANMRRLEEETGVSLTEVTPETVPAARAQIEAHLSDDVITDFEGKKVVIKVDGATQEIPLADVIREHQKGRAADRRLEEATALLQAAKLQAQQAPAPAAPPVSEPVTTPGPVEERIRQATASLYEGDTDTFVKVMSEIVAAPRGEESPAQVLSVEDVADEVQQRLAVDTAFATIQRDYPDVIADPDIELLTTIKVNQRVASGMPRDQAMLEGAKEVYSLLGKEMPGRPARGAGESRDEKLARKNTMDKIPVATVAAGTSVEDEAGEKDPSQLIREMSRRRMGQTMAA